MKRIIKIVLALAAILLALYLLLRWQGLLLFWDEAAPRRYETFGVDVSNYQGTVNWPALADQGVDFAFLKATEGSSLVDKQFSTNWANAQSAGVLAGAYHFFSYDSPGETQADNFIATVPVTPGALPPVVDIEFYGDYLKNPKPTEEVWPILDALLARLESHYGQKPILYVTGESYRLYVAGRYDDYPLWCTLPFISPFYAPWTFWQYSHHATLDGYDGAEKYIDLNVFRGTMDDLRAMLSAAPVRAIHESPAPASLPENTVQETFRPASYMDELTVAVTYGAGEPSIITITQNGETLQNFTEAADAQWVCALQSITVEDMNFDGYLDFRFPYIANGRSNYWEHVYLYDPYENRGFYKAEELDAYSSLSFDQESGTVYACNTGGWYETYHLLKWSGDGYAARRKLSREYNSEKGEMDFLVWDRNPATPLHPEEDEPADAWMQIAEWTGGEDIAPWLDPDYFGPNIPAPTEIPQDLTDFLLPLVAADTWRPFAQQFAAGKKMPSEEAEKLWDETAGWDGEGSYYLVDGLRLDADNDGTEDIFLSDTQGSGHFNFFYLFSGGNEVTDDGLLGNFTGGDFITWQGSRYLLVPSYDYDTRAFTGLDVYLFQDGKITRRAWLAREADSYQASDAWAAEGYESVLADLEDRAADLWSAFDESWEQPVGAAERLISKEEKRYSCDWNNDGIEEEYRKSTSFVNAYGRYLWLDGIDGKRLGGADPLQDENLQILWIDRRGDENLICTAYNWGDQPIHLEVRRCIGDRTELVASLTLTPAHASRLAAYETNPQLSYW